MIIFAPSPQELPPQPTQGFDQPCRPPETSTKVPSRRRSAVRALSHISSDKRVIVINGTAAVIQSDTHTQQRSRPEPRKPEARKPEDQPVTRPAVRAPSRAAALCCGQLTE